MRGHHWAFLATGAFAVPIASVLGVVLVPDPTVSPFLLAVACGTVGAIGAAVFVAVDGFDRVGATPPGKGRLIELVVLLPFAAVGTWLYAAPIVDGVAGVALFVAVVAGGTRVASSVRDRVGGGPDGRSTDGVTQP